MSLLILQSHSMRVDTVVCAFVLLLRQIQTQEFQHVSFITGKDVSLQCLNWTAKGLWLEKWEFNRTSRTGCWVIFRSDNNTVKSSCGDSRITIMKKHNSHVLHISHFQSSDEGSYRCQIAETNGTHTMHFKVSAQGNESDGIVSSEASLDEHLGIYASAGVISAALVLVIIFLTNIKYKTRNRSKRKNPAFYSKEDLHDFEPYSVYMEKTNTIYNL